ncbi:MAG: hypothetical protein JNM25_15330 [Planctomycetes bacterium]|nr:hypothetical protein [Planctomycetota bacterium]
MHTHRTSRVLVLACLSIAAACADGGKETRPQSEVKLTASHHMFGFRSLAGFGTFPVPATAVTTDRGQLNLFDDSSYTIARTSGTSAADRYALETDGALSIFVTGSGSEPSVLFRGGYSLAGVNPTTADYQFTDRVSTTNSPSIGLFYGTRVVTGQVELEGGWHLLSLHTIFGQTILSPENVGRGVHGGVSVGAGAAGTLRTVSGTGTQGTSTQGTSAVTFGGSIQNLLDGSSTGDGSCNLTVAYNGDSRVMFAAASDNVVYGLDADETDGEAGILFLVRKFDAPATPVDSVRVPGSFLVGGHTLFVNPSNPGSDAFTGVVTLTAQGGFRLDGVGNSGADFAYSGSYVLAADGHLTVTISGTNETWFAAIDRSYQTLLFVDDFIELRSNNTPELNIGLGVRRKT